MNSPISLVLGSGGARGLAHIGVIRELERQGFEISAVIGCSMGALIGGFYCAGKLDVYEQWVSELSEWDVLRFLDVSLTARAGMMKGDLIMDTLRGLVGDRRIEELPVSFTAVATDIRAKKEVWLNSGDLFDAIRASIAVPGIFTPKVIGGRTLIDGALLNPLPGIPATDTATSLTIAVNPSGRDIVQPPESDHPPAVQRGAMARYRSRIDSFLGRIQRALGMESGAETVAKNEMRLTDVLLSSFDTMQSAIARYRLAAYPPDILIEIPGNVCQAHEFYKAKAVIAAGQYWARQALEQQPGIRR